ncbi:hypothetical protein BJY01DRAFT_232809 [Aspergillus pseudoustus]|uniref:Mid2 domain-containing protein n=1 Tax=Aspergillus pseudoustus TaxID=1810923 RepID=A0ABR4KI07_9EURO
MAFFAVISILYILSTSAVASVIAPDSNNGALMFRNGPGMSDADTLYAVRIALDRARLESRDTVHAMNTTSLDKFWKDVTLYQGGTGTDLDPSTEIVCAACYISGSMSGEITLSDGFNISEALNSIESEVKAIASEAVDLLESSVENLAESVLDVVDSKSDDLVWPTPDIDFNLDNITSFTDVAVHLEFNNLEIYLDLETKLPGGSHTINLFTSRTPAGFSLLNHDLDIGVIFSVDLILIADVDTAIESGIHIKLDEGVTFDLKMFNKDIADITIPGGQYEFLPLTIEANGGYLRAVLRLQASIGVEVNLDIPDVISEVLDDLSIGVVTDLFAYIADIKMNIDGTSANGEASDCDLSADLEYTFAVGAAAGATVGANSHFWGPNVFTTVPIWTTTLTSTCAELKSPSTFISTAASAQITGRANGDDLVTTSIEQTYTIIACNSSTLVDCPASLQITSTNTATVTSVLTVQSGSPYSAATSTISFGDNAATISAISGAPTTYKSTSGGSNHKKLIIGLCVALAGTFLIVLVVGIR